MTDVPNELRDYQQWHANYDDPDSGLSWRLRTVQGYLRQAFDARSLEDHAGPVRVLSLCSGDGRDLIGVLAGRPDAGRVSATLVELHPDIAAAARRAAAEAGLSGVLVRTADAGHTEVWLGDVPADLVLLVGIFGNISDADVDATIAAAPQFCAPGATLIWSRGRAGVPGGDRNDAVRARFAAAGFTELDYATRDTGSRPALGAMRYDGPAVTPLSQRLFTFQR